MPTGPAGPPVELVRLVGPDAVVSHRPGLGSGAWFVCAPDGRSAVAVQSTSAASDMTRIAGDSAVGPTVLGVHDGWVLTERLRGSTLTPVELRRPHVLREVAALLARWHSTPSGALRVEPATADLAASLRGYTAAAGTLDPTLQAEVTWAESTLDQLAADQAGPVLCHLDVAANVVATPRGLQLIDFEYAALADPGQELGQLIWDAELDPASADLLVDAYRAFSSGDTPVTVAAAATWCVAVGVTWTVWAMASGGATMPRYARRSRERLASHWARAQPQGCG
jgi:thiamine kinase-like enzyme